MLQQLRCYLYLFKLSYLYIEVMKFFFVFHFSNNKHDEHFKFSNQSDNIYSARRISSAYFGWRNRFNSNTK